VADARLVPGLPLKILRGFRADEEHLLEPGDLLYLPPGWGHEGIAVGECMTASIGFRAPAAGELAAELLGRLADAAVSGVDASIGRYADPGQAAVASPGRLPPALGRFALRSLRERLADAGAIRAALGEALTEPKPRVQYGAGRRPRRPCAIVLDRGTRMLYDEKSLFINGESFNVGGADAVLLRRLADAGRLNAAGAACLSRDAWRIVADWVEDGWLHAAAAEE
jgi:50S ribosomal protein L16 3-hydroxylase